MILFTKRLDYTALNTKRLSKIKYNLLLCITNNYDVKTCFITNLFKLLCVNPYVLEKIILSYVVIYIHIFIFTFPFNATNAPKNSSTRLPHQKVNDFLIYP